MELFIIIIAIVLCSGMVLWVEYDKTYNNIWEWKKKNRDKVKEDKK